MTATQAEISIGADVIRVASVPSGHVYVRHLTSVSGGSQIVRLQDPKPADSRAEQSRWWPPVMLDPEWIATNAELFDVFHVQFGFDALSPTELQTIVDALCVAGKPLIYTVHDLRNPHHIDPAWHDAQLDVLVPQADAVLTLTPGAADVIRARWHRDAVVVAHPHVVPLDQITPRSPRAGSFVVGVHAKSLRAGMAPGAVVSGLLDLLAELDELELRVDIHHDVYDRDGARYDSNLRSLLDEAERPGFRVVVHDYFSDDALWNYLASLDVSVLPYRFGTHSGWLEACYDLGTTVVAPDCGFYVEQQRCLTYRHDERRLDVESLRDTVRWAYANRPVWQADSSARSSQRDEISRIHKDVYNSVRG